MSRSHSKNITSELLIQHASNDDSSGYKRNEDGTLKFWYEWSKLHPQRNDEVKICQGQLEWSNMLNESNDLSSLVSIVSWNILSETWFCKGRGNYAHTPDILREWNYRFQCLLNWIKNLNSDILMLQEVDYDVFVRDLEPELQKLGYEGVMQSQKNDSKSSKKKQPCGVATFWKVDKFQMLTNKSFSRSMITLLQQSIQYNNDHTTKGQKKNQKKMFCVANVHLESSHLSNGAEKRARQLNSPLKWAKEQIPQSCMCPLIICGDFNTGSDSNLFDVLRNERWHNHSLANVYEHPSTSRTLPVSRATYAVPYHHYAIDHILYSHNKLQLRHVLNAFNEKETIKNFGPSSIKGPMNKRGFPNLFCPSDHIPIGATFELPTSLSAYEDGTFTNSHGGDHNCMIDDVRKLEIERQLQNLMIKVKSISWKGKAQTDEELMLRRSMKAKLKKWKESFRDNDAEYRFVCYTFKKAKN